MKDGADREMEKETKREQKRSVTATLEGFGYSTNPSVRNSPDKSSNQAPANGSKGIAGGRAAGGGGKGGGGSGGGGGMIPGKSKRSTKLLSYESLVENIGNL